VIVVIQNTLEKPYLTKVHMKQVKGDNVKKCYNPESFAKNKQDCFPYFKI
jgi:hypothetical protein